MFDHNNYRSYQSSIPDIKHKESELIAMGYRKAFVPNNLQPMEYSVSYFHGTPRSFEGPGGGTLTWRES